MSKEKKKKCKDRHHITPRSRGGNSKLENIAIVNTIGHQKYHSLFSNQTPGEIIETLVNKYWNGQWDYVADAYNKNNGIYSKPKRKS